MPEALQTEDSESTTEEVSSYQIDPSWYEKNDRSLALSVARRRCPACQKKALRDRGGKEWEDQMKAIVDHCSKEATFIMPETTTVEAAFRIILANGNRPTSLEDIYTEIRRRWSLNNSLKDITLGVLRRMLDRDTFYGIRNIDKEGGPAS